jgi:Uma2 family endonuclease
LRVQNPLGLPQRSEPVPDVMLLHRRADFYRNHHPTAAESFLVIEVADTSLRFDRNVKIPLYARQGVPEAWIVDLRGDAVLTYGEPSEHGYRVVETKRRGESITIAALPDLTIQVDEILG